MNQADRISETKTDMSHPLIQRLYDEFSYPRVTLEDYATFIGAPGVSVLFFAGDPKRYKETTDVAVVLPELIAAFEGNIRAGVVDKSAELPLQKRLGFRAWPCLVFFREGKRNCLPLVQGQPAHPFTLERRQRLPGDDRRLVPQSGLSVPGPFRPQHPQRPH